MHLMQARIVITHQLTNPNRMAKGGSRNPTVSNPATAYASDIEASSRKAGGVGSERGQRAPRAVPDMEAYRDHRDGVGQTPPTRSGSRSLLGRRALAAGATGMNDVPRQVQEVVDHEEHDHDPAPAQGERGVAALYAGP